jgi:hypothetical protein
MNLFYSMLPMQGLTFVFHLNHFHLYYLLWKLKKQKKKQKKALLDSEEILRFRIGVLKVETVRKTKTKTKSSFSILMLLLLYRSMPKLYKYIITFLWLRKP